MAQLPPAPRDTNEFRLSNRYTHIPIHANTGTGYTYSTLPAPPENQDHSNYRDIYLRHPFSRYGYYVHTTFIIWSYAPPCSLVHLEYEGILQTETTSNPLMPTKLPASSLFLHSPPARRAASSRTTHVSLSRLSNKQTLRGTQQRADDNIPPKVAKLRAIQINNTPRLTAGRAGPASGPSLTEPLLCSRS